MVFVPSALMLLSTRCCEPLPSATTETTDAMGFHRQCRHAKRLDEAIAYRAPIAVRCRRSGRERAVLRRHLQVRTIRDDLAVANFDDALSVLGDCDIVRDQDDRMPFGVQL